jgi:hypothetical protein
MAGAIVFFAIAMITHKGALFEFRITVEHKHEAAETSIPVDISKMMEKISKEDEEMYRNQPSVISLLNEILNTGEIKDPEEKHNG